MSIYGDNDDVCSLRDFSLKDLKVRAVKLGIRGTTSRTKYTKQNKSKLIDDILLVSGSKTIMTGDNDNEDTKNQQSVRRVPDRTEDPRIWTSVRDVDEKNILSEHPKQSNSDDAISFKWVLGTVCTIAITSALIFGSILTNKDSNRVPSKGDPPRATPIDTLVRDM